MEELASLLKKSKKNGVHREPVFDVKQTRCWTIDKRPSTVGFLYLGGWVVDFRDGTLKGAQWMKRANLTRVDVQEYKNETNYVKAVRSVK
jgi:hypothetical protein